MSALGLDATVSAALRAHVVKVLDMLVTECCARFGQPDATEREVVDEIRRWAIRQDDLLVPMPEPGPSNGHRRLCPACGQAVVQEGP